MRRARNRPRLASPFSRSNFIQADFGIVTEEVPTFSPGVMGFLPAPALAPPCCFSSLTAPNKAPSS